MKFSDCSIDPQSVWPTLTICMYLAPCGWRVVYEPCAHLFWRCLKSVGPAPGETAVLSAPSRFSAITAWAGAHQRSSAFAIERQLTFRCGAWAGIVMLVGNGVVDFGLSVTSVPWTLIGLPTAQAAGSIAFNSGTGSAQFTGVSVGSGDLTLSSSGSSATVSGDITVRSGARLFLNGY